MGDEWLQQTICTGRWHTERGDAGNGKSRLASAEPCNPLQVGRDTRCTGIDIIFDDLYGLVEALGGINRVLDGEGEHFSDADRITVAVVDECFDIRGPVGQ